MTLANNDNGAEMPADNFVVHSLRSLLRAMRCESVPGLADTLDDSSERDVFVHGLGRFAGDGIEIRVGTRGTELSYPFTVGQIWSTLANLEDEDEASDAYENLAQQIGDVEKFIVGVVINYDVDPANVKPRHNRRQLRSGDIVELPLDYPYRKAMSGSRTFADWLVNRFERNYPGLEQ